MVEPFYDDTGEGIIHTDMWAERFKDLRQYALSLPKFGTTSADKEVGAFITYLLCICDYCSIVVTLH